MKLPYGVAPSNIHGVGAFAARLIRKGERVRMPDGELADFRGFNHSCDSNLSPAFRGGYRWALRDISPGEELTVDYGFRPTPCRCLRCLTKIVVVTARSSGRL